MLNYKIEIFTSINSLIVTIKLRLPMAALSSKRCPQTFSSIPDKKQAIFTVWHAARAMTGGASEMVRDIVLRFSCWNTIEGTMKSHVLHWLTWQGNVPVHYLTTNPVSVESYELTILSCNIASNTQIYWEASSIKCSMGSWIPGQVILFISIILLNDPNRAAPKGIILNDPHRAGRFNS
jgi:hypothetical protein